jgi:hypothetical protein
MDSVLTALQTALSRVSGVASCKIGLEANITADDYPLIRLVPSVMKPSEVWPRQKMELLIYGGVKNHAFEGMDVVYAEMFALEAAIRARMEQGGSWVAVWEETVWDEDRLPHYKLFAMRWRVEG